MFELPDAKSADQNLAQNRVRRQDLGESSGDEGADHDEQQNADLLAKLHARMAGMLDLGDADADQAPTEMTEQPATATDGETGGNGGGEDEPEEFEFRLFTTSNPATKIALVDEDERAMAGDGAMIRKRPLSYYIAGEPTPEVKAELAFAAVSGEEVLERAQRRWWGMEQPWRVTTIPGITVSSKGTAGTAAGDVGETKEEADAAAARRRRPGKKKRLAIRVKQRERVKKAEELEKFKAGKEEALKEKKKRLNRLKKLRKRAKAKEGKNGGGDGGESGSGSDGDE
ncbi:hypothetical protein Landi51_12597 [Colletotrichum acutatum]